MTQQSANAIEFVLHQMQVRHHLSCNHLYSAYLFAQTAAEIEQSTDLDRPKRLAHQSYVTSSIMSSVGFIEACVNELFTICAEHPDDTHVSGHPQDDRFNSIGDDAITKLGVFWQLDNFQRHGKLLDKYQTALRLAGKPEFDEGANPFQDIKLAVQLRNLLVHFKPKQQDVAVGTGNTLPPGSFEMKCRGKFQQNPLCGKFAGISGSDGPLDADRPFFPEKCLGSGCAMWSFTSSLQFANEFFSALGTTWYYHYLFDKGLIPQIAT